MEPRDHTLQDRMNERHSKGLEMLLLASHDEGCTQWVGEVSFLNENRF